jgi:hypothetical protein
LVVRSQEGEVEGQCEPPGKARTIAAIFTQMDNVRTKWVRLAAPHLKVPPQLDRAHCTPPDDWDPQIFGYFSLKRKRGGANS